MGPLKVVVDVTVLVTVVARMVLVEVVVGDVVTVFVMVP